MREILKNDWRNILVLAFLPSTIIGGIIFYHYQINIYNQLREKYKHQNEGDRYDLAWANINNLIITFMFVIGAIFVIIFGMLIN